MWRDYFPFLARQHVYAIARLSYRREGSVCVCHTAVLCQNDETQDHDICIVGCHNNSSFLRENFVQLRELPTRVSLERKRQREPPVQT